MHPSISHTLADIDPRLLTEAFRRARARQTNTGIDADSLLSAIIAEARRGTRDLYGLTRAADVAAARAVLDADKAIGSPAARRQFLRGAYDPAAGTVRPVGGSGSHLIAALAHADCLLVVPEDVTSVEPGAEVEVVLLG